MKMDAAGFARYMRQLSRTLVGAVSQGQRDAAADAQRLLRQRSLEQDPNDRGLAGRFAQCWVARLSGDEVSFTNTEPFAYQTEYGRDAGEPFPPITLLSAWLQRNKGLSGSNLDRATYLLGRSIVANGIPGRFILSTALPEIVDMVNDSISDALEKAERATVGT